MPGTLLPIALTMGEPAGIGGEIALMAWLRRGPTDPCFYAVDSPRRLAALARRVGLPAPVVEIAAPEEAAAAFATALPVLPLASDPEPVLGRPDPVHAAAVIESIDRAVAAVQAGRAAAVVTNPIQKEALYAAGFPHAGHTEYLAALAGGGVHPIMMLACPELRVVPVTVHRSLRAAIEMVSAELIVTAGRITAAALKRDFGIPAPVLAVAGLNPHAGENGSLGSEEIEIIVPAIERLRAEGIDVRGPQPADTMFHARARARYDAALCMYHDQALIPLKTIDFDGGVNITLGLPFVRTSPDHGTAIDIAGTGKALPDSLIAALRLAAAIAVRRGHAAGPAPATIAAE
ncbi:MAG: 4-hydroxythreonine-4-phosphate dehydrogenase PdxA [Alphaproteobacteria bacterium]|nr:4-hydroxythreonine-4-phosphate dehydrogenase PdxA [Alphaproteobacteria bacterium]